MYTAACGFGLAARYACQACRCSSTLFFGSYSALVAWRARHGCITWYVMCSIVEIPQLCLPRTLQDTTKQPSEYAVRLAQFSGKSGLTEDAIRGMLFVHLGTCAGHSVLLTGNATKLILLSRAGSEHRLERRTASRSVGVACTETSGEVYADRVVQRSPRS